MNSLDSQESFFPFSSGRYSILLIINKPAMKVIAKNESVDLIEFQEKKLRIM
jgi:hypothetical protein